MPDGFRLDFDPANEDPAAAGVVLKTFRRTVISLRYGRFQARETVRREAEPGGCKPRRSGQLARLVPAGASYAFDVIAHLGVEIFLHGRDLEDLQRALAERRPALTIPLSTIWDQAQKFLFYLGCLHERATPLLRQYLAEHAPVTWLLDGTCEPGTAVFLGIQEAASGILLSGRKIPSENATDIAPCLASAATHYGPPARVLHDLSPAMKGACDKALSGTHQGVCHYHLARDIGEDLYQQPQDALSKRLRSLKLQFRLHEQRRWQSRWLRGQPERVQFVLEALWEGRSLEAPFDQTLGREVLLALHFWILDYPSDGRRQGFPFDPYLLYLHRRLVRAAAMVDRLLADADVARQAPQPLFHLQEQLRQYSQDAQIRTALCDVHPAPRSVADVRGEKRHTPRTLRVARQSGRGTEGGAGALPSRVAAGKWPARRYRRRAGPDRPETPGQVRGVPPAKDACRARAGTGANHQQAGKKLGQPEARPSPNARPGKADA